MAGGIKLRILDDEQAVAGLAAKFIVELLRRRPAAVRHQLRGSRRGRGHRRRRRGLQRGRRLFPRQTAFEPRTGAYAVHAFTCTCM